MPLAKIRTALSNRFIERREYRRLSAELAAFRTPAERTELEEMLSRYPVEETRLIRDILYRHDQQRQLAAAVVGSHHRVA